MSESSRKQSQGKMNLGTSVMLSMALLTALGLGLMVVPDWLAPQVTIIQAAQDLPSLAVISATHLTTGTLPALQAAGVVTAMTDAVGQVTTQALAKGEALSKAVLLTLPKDRWLLSVPISDTVPPAVGETVALFGVQPGTDTATLLIDDAVVLLVEDGIALVAIAPEQAKDAASYLATPKQLVLVRRLR